MTLAKEDQIEQNWQNLGSNWQKKNNIKTELKQLNQNESQMCILTSF